LKIFVDQSLDKQPNSSGALCCLQGDVNVSTFSAPASSGRTDIA
jgi:hypothetical protein